VRRRLGEIERDIRKEYEGMLMLGGRLTVVEEDVLLVMSML